MDNAPKLEPAGPNLPVLIRRARTHWPIALLVLVGLGWARRRFDIPETV